MTHERDDGGSGLRLIRRWRVADWERLLARVQVFGFTVCDDGNDLIQIERDGRKCAIYLGAAVRHNATDPRDAWLLSLALEDGAHWELSETYFLWQAPADVAVPVYLNLGRRPDRSRTLYLQHGIVGRIMDETLLPNADALLDALPFLAPSNAVGYHRARQRIIDCYERLRPRTWADVGIFDLDIIAEYERHQVSANDIAHAAEGGIVGKERIIAVFGVPADNEWVDIKS